MSPVPLILPAAEMLSALSTTVTSRKQEIIHSFGSRSYFSREFCWQLPRYTGLRRQRSGKRNRVSQFPHSDPISKYLLFSISQDGHPSLDGRPGQRNPPPDAPARKRRASVSFQPHRDKTQKRIFVNMQPILDISPRKSYDNADRLFIISWMLRVSFQPAPAGLPSSPCGRAFFRKSS